MGELPLLPACAISCPLGLNEVSDFHAEAAAFQVSQHGKFIVAMVDDDVVAGLGHARGYRLLRDVILLIIVGGNDKFQPGSRTGRQGKRNPPTLSPSRPQTGGRLE